MGVVGEVEVQEDGGENGRVSEKREDSHLAATGWAEQRKHLVDPREEYGPADAGKGGGGSGRLGGLGRRGGGRGGFGWPLGPAERDDVRARFGSSLNSSTSETKSRQLTLSPSST